MFNRMILGLVVLSAVLALPAAAGADDAIRMGTFAVDATPPLGSPLAYDPLKEVVMPLSCRGVVLLGDEQPIVLCAIDWIGIGNDGHKQFRQALAEAVGTTPGRVALHAVHQHDAPALDFSAEALLKQHGAGGVLFNVDHARQVIADASTAVAQAVDQAVPITHIGQGEGTVEQVASNRRIQDDDGKVLWTRYTSGASQERNRLAPVGLIDPKVKLITFYQDDKPLAALTYYACHPQSYYRTGGANPDFPGIARQLREEATGTFHVHFSGAGGNIGAGKWNDGSPPYRQILADRLAAGIEAAWESVERSPITATDLDWGVAPVALPLGGDRDAEDLAKRMANETVSNTEKAEIARNLAWAQRCDAGDTIDLQCLHLKQIRVLHMPGELLVEYQLAAQKMRPDLFVAMAAYGDYAPGYICLDVHYGQGGYEGSPRASRVAPPVEQVLMQAMAQLLETDK